MKIRACLALSLALWLISPESTAIAQESETRQKEETIDEVGYTPSSKIRRNKKRSIEREAFVSREKVVQKDTREVTFDEVELLGQDKRPSIRDITGAGANRDYNFLKIRLHWNPEMIQSASHLDSGPAESF